MHLIAVQKRNRCDYGVMFPLKQSETSVLAHVFISRQRCILNSLRAGAPQSSSPLRVITKALTGKVRRMHRCQKKLMHSRPTTPTT